MKSNLIQCLRCKKSLIREEWDEHVCSRQFRGIRNIEVLQWWETKSDQGERVAFGIGSDGYTYKMTEAKEGFIELDSTNRHLTGRNTNREANRTCVKVLYKWWDIV